MSVHQGLGHLPLTELRVLLQRREVSPVEVVEQVIEALDALDPQLNAVVHRLDAAARAQAGESEARLLRGEGRALEGLPIPIKDNMMVAGSPMTIGTRMAPTFDMPEDHELVARLRRAGAVFPGKTNLPEFGTIPSTESVRLGACHNPWDLTRTPGGSSGGAAALVAARVVAAAHGNDGGGSLRIPSACCNLFTLKPTRGLLTKGPLDDDGFGFVTDGFLTRTVRDNALLLDEVAGSGLGDPIHYPRPAEPFSVALEREPRRLRIAFTAASPLDWLTVHPAHQQAVRDAAALCADLGHDVEEHNPDWGGVALVDTFMKIWSTLVAQGMELLALLGGDITQVEPNTAALHRMSTAMTAPQFALAFAEARGWSRRMLQLHATYDVILTPTLLEPPFPLGRIFEGSEADPLAPMATAQRLAAFTAGCNVTGQPAVNLPLFMHDGLPVGIMAAGRPGDDALLLQLSAQLEAARPWADRRPPLVA